MTSAELYSLICDNPGITTGELAKRAGVQRATITSWIAKMERVGLLVYFERRGRDEVFFPFEETTSDEELLNKGRVGGRG
jgi:predicted transcriptional regulator